MLLSRFKKIKGGGGGGVIQSLTIGRILFAYLMALGQWVIRNKN